MAHVLPHGMAKEALGQRRPPPGSVWYRTTFALPAECSDLSVRVSVHADNAAAVYLNGTKIGEQPRLEISENFRDPAESYAANDPALFVCGGTNVLEFELYNFGNPTALDYKAVITPIVARPR